MPHNLSFAQTTAQFEDGSKDVTRRLGWKFLEPGMVLCAIRKGQGLKLGEKVQRLGMIRVVSVRPERLETITRDDVRREGFPDWSPEKFVTFFCKGHNDCRPQTVVTRIEFERVVRSAPQPCGMRDVWIRLSCRKHVTRVNLDEPHWITLDGFLAERCAECIMEHLP